MLAGNRFGHAPAGIARGDGAAAARAIAGRSPAEAARVPVRRFNLTG
ncbi:hypothetical protein FHS88_001043 [Roseomonas alkaliterrae]|uniref:Uncharacterized protein n=1 Tax=Neoroseomonas alkaliterrae TaxID=1452450 RepID=A0A840XXN3_9PROT|nr:hypothetical protein [Neoroseomonas alkaliterrae]